MMSRYSVSGQTAWFQKRLVRGNSGRPVGIVIGGFTPMRVCAFSLFNVTFTLRLICKDRTDCTTGISRRRGAEICQCNFSKKVSNTAIIHVNELP